MKIDFDRLKKDFKGLDPKEIWEWPTIPKNLTLAGMIAGLIAGSWFLFGDGLLSEIDAAQVKVESKKSEYLDKKSQAVNLELHKTQLVEIDKLFGKLLKQLPSKSEVDNLLIEVNQSGLGRGLQFELFKPGPEVMKDFYAELPVQIRVKGKYDSLGFFAEDVGKLSRVISISDINLVTDVSNQKDPKADKNNVTLAMDATLKTFRYLDEGELAEQRAAEKAKKGKKG